jgi:hypothetical protein
MLVIIRDGPDYHCPSGGKPVRTFICECDCGNIVTVHRTKWRYTRSCRPCAHLSHGHARRSGLSRTYRSWRNMIQRCENPNCLEFHRYGGDGVTICERWHSFPEFLADMGECPPRLTIERVDNEAGYFPGNCIWATYKTQNRNQSSNIVLSFSGVTACLGELCERFNMPYYKVYYLLSRGWSIEDAFARFRTQTSLPTSRHR